MKVTKYDLSDTEKKRYKEHGSLVVSHWKTDLCYEAKLCNFSLIITRRVEKAPGSSIGENGWVVEIKTQNNLRTSCVITTSIVSSSAGLNRYIMSNVAGTVCQLKSQDFLDFVSHDNPEQKVYCVGHIGKVTIEQVWYWMFSNRVLDEKGYIIKKPNVILAKDSLLSNFVIPDPLPSVSEPAQDARQRMRHLGQCIRAVYPHTYMQVLHILASVLKGLHFDTLLSQENFVSVCNVSGAANVGKTLACAIALSLCNSTKLMLSRCTISSMLDCAHLFKNLLIVWDDPRNTTHGQLSSIVHEAFNGVASTTISKGLRQYNSALIIGTQEPLLGMPYNSVNAATFSRMSHVNFNVPDAFFNFHKENELQCSLGAIRDDILPYMIRYTEYKKHDVDTIYKTHYAKYQTKIIGRSLRIAAIDHYFMSQLFAIMDLDSKDDIDAYFHAVYVPFLNANCSRVTPFDRFLIDLAQLIRNNVDIPKHCYKRRVMIDLKEVGQTECFALYPKSMFEFMANHLPQPSNYTKEMIHSHVKNSQVGDVSRNVAYKLDDNSIVVKRSIVIRSSHLDQHL